MTVVAPLFRPGLKVGGFGLLSPPALPPALRGGCRLAVFLQRAPASAGGGLPSVGAPIHCGIGSGGAGAYMKVSELVTEPPMGKSLLSATQFEKRV